MRNRLMRHGGLLTHWDTQPVRQVQTAKANVSTVMNLKTPHQTTRQYAGTRMGDAKLPIQRTALMIDRDPITSSQHTKPTMPLRSHISVDAEVRTADTT